MNRNPMQISAALEVVSPQVSLSTERKAMIDRPATLRGVSGKTLICVEGQLWVTQEGDPADHLLKAGEKLNLAGRGTVVVSAFPRAAYVLD